MKKIGNFVLEHTARIPAAGVMFTIPHYESKAALDLHLDGAPVPYDHFKVTSCVVRCNTVHFVVYLRPVREGTTFRWKDIPNCGPLFG